MIKTLVASGLLLVLTNGSTFAQMGAQSGPQTVHGMTVTTLEGAFEFDSDGVALRGYIDPNSGHQQAPMQAGNPQGPAARQAANLMVAFHVCNSSQVLQVNKSLLHESPPCRKTGHSVWEAWRLQG